MAGGTQSINQDGGGVGNQAGQGQGNNNNIATINQVGGSGDYAIQNQGLMPGSPGYMYVSGGTLVHS